MRYKLTLSTLMACCVMAASIPLGFAAGDNLGLGLYQKPEYPGSEDYEMVVLPSADVTLGAIGLTLRGVDLSVDLIPSPALNAGLTVRYDEGRDDSVTDKTIRLMTPVDAAAEFGLYIESGLPVRLLGVDDSALLIASANLRTAFDAGHGGKVFELRVGVLRELTPRLTGIVQLVMVQSDARYNRAYFGVDNSDAQLTGLDEYTPGKSHKETGATLVLNRQLSGRWYAGVTATVTRLSSELANSPIVKTLGSRTQWITGAFLTYHF